jgi:hypothetical protein
MIDIVVIKWRGRVKRCTFYVSLYINEPIVVAV